MAPYASNLRQSARASQGNLASTPVRSSARKTAARVIRPAGFTHLSSVRLGLQSFWDLGLLDRLHEPLTHYHE